MTDRQEDRWLTVEQVADRFQVVPETVRRWIRNGVLPALDMGGPKAGYRIRESAIEEFVAKRYGPIQIRWVLEGENREIDLVASISQLREMIADTLQRQSPGTSRATVTLRLSKLLSAHSVGSSEPVPWISQDPHQWIVYRKPDDAEQ